MKLNAAWEMHINSFVSDLKEKQAWEAVCFIKGTEQEEKLLNYFLLKNQAPFPGGISTNGRGSCEWLVN